MSGALVGCARFGSWAACGLTQAGPLNARGQGYSAPKEASAWVVSVGARAQWEWVFADPIGLRLHLDAASEPHPPEAPDRLPGGLDDAAILGLGGWRPLWTILTVTDRGRSPQ